MGMRFAPAECVLDKFVEVGKCVVFWDLDDAGDTFIFGELEAELDEFGG